MALRARKRWIAAAVVVFVVSLGLPGVVPVAALATAATPITDCASDSAAADIAADFEAGGSYIFKCGTTRSFVDFTSPITVATDLSVDVASGQPVSLLGTADTGRFMTIEGGSVSLSNLDIARFTQVSAPLPPFLPTNGQDGTSGTNGRNGGAPGDDGTDGTDGGVGGPGLNGADGNASGAAQGGALLIESGATVTLTGDIFDADTAYGQQGGAGGAGGFGGQGGSGGGDGTTSAASYGDGGTAGASGDGGNGGTGGNGGSAQGGAIYNAGDLTITGTTFSGNSATGGLGGWGGNGGGVWPGGWGGVGCDNDVYEGTVSGSGGGGGSAGTAGNAGAGGNGGSAKGGAIYNTGSVTFATGDTFSSNTARAGNGGAGGNNQQSYTYSQSDSGGGSYGSGSTGGPGGPAGVWILAEHNGDGPPVHTGCGSGGAAGGAGHPGATEPGGNAGDAQGGALYDGGTVTASAPVFLTSNTAAGGHGGAGGNGGNGGNGQLGGNQNGNVESGPYANPFGATPGTDASPSAGADGSNGGNGGNADSGAFASTSLSLLGSATCNGNSVTGGSGGSGGVGGSGGGGAYQSGQSNASNGINGAAGAQGGATNAQANCADELEVGVSDPAEPGGTPCQLNAVVPVTVTISAPATNHDTISGIGFIGAAPVLWSPQSNATSSDDTDPGSPFSLAPGAQHKFIYHLTVDQLGTIGLTSSVSGTAPSGAVTASGSNSIQTASPLQVTVTTNPGTPIHLDDNVHGWVPKTVDAIVTVKNIGTAPITQVRLDHDLVITVAHGTPKVGEIPIDQPSGGPKHAKLGTLAPGQSAHGTYVLNVRGDGTYDISAEADGIDSNQNKASGVGDGVVDINGQFLIWKASLPDPNKLIPAGKTFLVNVTLENHSYQNTVEIAPMHAGLTGNAQDGHVQLTTDPIPDADTTSSCDAGDAEPIDPRTSRDYETVVRTASSDPQLTGATGPGGGTRAEVTFDAPKGNVVNDDGTLGPALVPSHDEVIASNSQDFIAHIDDKGFPEQPPKNWFGVTWYLSKGLFIGAGEALVGMVHGVLVDLPKLIGHGIVGLPHAILTYTQLEAELWNSIKDNPAAKAAFFSVIGNQVLLAYKNAPLLKKQADQAVASINAAVLAHFTKLWSDWYSGDWKGAVQTFGEESGDAITNVGLLLAPCVLAKLPAVTAAFDTAKAAAFAKAANLLAKYPEAIEWIKAIDALGKIAPGYELSNSHLLQFAGIDGQDANWLRSIAEPSAEFPDGLLVTFRPRSAEAAQLLNDGAAVLKPDAIKLKTVSDELDVQFLGYSPKASSRIAIRDFPTNASGKPSLQVWETQIKAALRRQGLTPSDPEWVAALDRAAFRFADETKYIQTLEKYAKDGHVTLRWDLASNLMDPTVLTSTPVSYPFRLQKLPNGDRLAEFLVKGKWRAVTGDVDFLDISGGNGVPLSLHQQAEVYKKFAGGPVGMPHGFSAMWDDPTKGADRFDFALKRAQFTKGTAVQIGPDRVARAVTFNDKMSEFNNELDYYIQWNGGYTFP